MPARKRSHAEIEALKPAETSPFLKKLRNNWRFANLMQYIYIFGDAVRIDRDFDIEDLEAECLRPNSSPKLAEIGLCLLKNVSSHRGLTPENFDEYVRRQYQSKKPSRNPFGDDEIAKSFHDFDIIQKLKVLVDLSQWTLINANNIKEKMEISEKDQASDWRIEPCGWDRDDRTYFVLDDNRLYRQTDLPIEVPDSPRPVLNGKGGRPKGKGKAKPKSTPTRGSRASKRLKIEHDEEAETDDHDEDMVDEDDTKLEDSANVENLPQDDDDLFGGTNWECVAVSLEGYNEFLSTIQKSRDPNEKALFKFITDSVMPIINAAEEKRRQKILRRQRDLEAVQKLATAKRSSRIADKRQHEVEEAENRALEEKRRQDLVAAQAMLQRELKMEQDRDSRRLTREQRIKDRELRRVLEEEALNNLTVAEAQSEQSEGEGRKSKRQLKAEIERKRKAVEELQQEENWIFDCSGCGVYGPNLDDGSHSLACDRCNVWQHSACLGISQADAEKDDFHLICNDCLRKEEEAKRPKPPPIKLKLNQSSSSPPSAKKVKREYLNLNGSPKLSKSKKQVNGNTSVGSGQWHNTFAYPQPPMYGSAPGSFVAFKPEKYYNNGALPVQEASGSSGFGANYPPRVAGQPPIGKFVNHSPKAAHPYSQQSSPPKHIANGHSTSSMGHKAAVDQASTNGNYAQSEKAQPSSLAAIDDRSAPPQLSTITSSVQSGLQGLDILPIQPAAGLNGTTPISISNELHTDQGRRLASDPAFDQSRVPVVPAQAQQQDERK